MNNDIDDRDDGRRGGPSDAATPQDGADGTSGKSLKSGVSSSEMQDAGMGEDESPSE